MDAGRGNPSFLGAAGRLVASRPGAFRSCISVSSGPSHVSGGAV